MNNELKYQTGKSPRFVLSGGGTGGHLFPAISIADELKKKYPDSAILFVGAQGKMEMEKVPKAGYKIIPLWISGLYRGKIISNLLLPFKVISSLFKSWRILAAFKPNVAIGTGGFASAPLLYMAEKMSIPTLIQEQNYFPGLTNRILSKKADIICAVDQTLSKYFPEEKLVVSGNPVRSALLHDSTNKEVALKHFELKSNVQTVLFMGGSLGARAINNALMSKISEIRDSDFQLLWQTGSLYIDEVNNALANEPADNIKAQAFIDDMPKAYRAADLVVCRAGAITLAELGVLAKPSILIPSPNVADNHQEKNADALEKQQAAIKLKDSELEHKLIPGIQELLNNQDRLTSLSEAISRTAHKDALDIIINEIEKIKRA